VDKAVTSGACGFLPKDGHFADLLTTIRTARPGALAVDPALVTRLLDKPATATVRASSDVEVYAIAEPLEFLRDKPGAALAVLRLTAARLDGMTQYLVDVKQQYADRDDHLG